MLTGLRFYGLAYAVGEPDLRYTPAQKEVASLSIATNHQWHDDGGGKHEESCFIDCTCWGNLAKVVSEHVAQGDPLYVEGNLKQERWDKDGEKRSKHVLSLTRVIFLKPRDESSAE